MSISRIFLMINPGRLTENFTFSDNLDSFLNILDELQKSFCEIYWTDRKFSVKSSDVLAWQKIFCEIECLY